MGIDFDPLDDWRRMAPVDLTVADFDFSRMKEEVTRQALRPKRPKKMAPDIATLIEEFANCAAQAARNPRSSIKGIRAARSKLQHRLAVMKLGEAERKTAMRAFDGRWPEILVGTEGAALQERIRKWT